MADDWSQFKMDDAPAGAAPAAAPPAPADGRGAYGSGGFEDAGASANPDIPAGATNVNYDQNGKVAGYVDQNGKMVVNINGGDAPPSDPWGQFKMDDRTGEAEPAPVAAPEAAPAAPVGHQAPTTWLGNIGVGVRELLEGGGQVLNTLQSPISVPWQMLGLKAEDYEKAADALADHIGLPTPADDDHIGHALRRGLASGILTAGAAAPLAAAAPADSAVGAVASQFAASPVTDAISAGAGQAAGAAVKDQGYGPWAQFAAMLAAGAVPGGLGALGSAARSGGAADLADVAARLGVTPTPATVGGAVPRLVQKGLSNLPGAGAAVAAGAHREAGELAQAARNTAAGIGQVGTRQSAGEAVARGAQAFDRGTRAAGGALYRQRDALMGGSDAPVSLNNTRQAYADIRSQFPNSEALADLRQHPALRRLENALPEAHPSDPDAGMLTLGEATDALSHVRGVKRNLAARSQATPAITRRVSAVEQALEDDVMNAARASDQATGRAAGAGSAEQAQTDADAYWANRSRILENALGKPMKSAREPLKVSGEQVYNGLVADMQRKGGNLLRFRQAWSSLPRASRNAFAATLLDDMGRAKAGVQNAEGTGWSFNTFLSNYDDMAPGARMIAFGGREQTSAIDDIARYSARLRDIGAGANHSNTASHTMAGAFMATLGGALLHGDIKLAAEIAGTAAATYPAARLFMATPAMRQWTRNALGVTARRAPAPQSAFTPLVRRLTTIAANDPAIAQPVLDLQNRLTSGLIPQGAVAGEPDKRGKQ